MSRILLSSLILILLSACGISQQKKEDMLVSLDAGINEALLAQDSFVAFTPKVELTKVERSGSGYTGMFSCTFTDGGKRVYMSGGADFDKAGCLERKPTGKLSIRIGAISVDNRMVSVSTSIYDVPMFSTSHLNRYVAADENIVDSVPTTSSVTTETSGGKYISLKEYVDNLKEDGLTMFHIEGDNVLIFTRWDAPVGGNANSQAEALYRQAKDAHVYNIKTVRVIKMPEQKVIGRYVTR